MAAPLIQVVDGVPVRLREAHDLSFLARWGRVFTVFDQQDSGNLCFGVEGPSGRRFVKYAGAPTERYQGRVEDAVRSLRAAATRYRALAQPSLLPLLDSVDLGPGGHALVFPWTDAVPLGRQFDRRQVLDGLTPAQRAEAVQQLLDVHVEVAARGWVAVDLYDGTVMIDPTTARVTLCDIDFYQPTPYLNPVGRMWGSTRFMSPEEFRLGAVIDELTTVHTLGVLAHTLLGDDRTRAPEQWLGTRDQYEIAARAVQPERHDRWGSIAEMAEAWRATLEGGGRRAG